VGSAKARPTASSRCKGSPITLSAPPTSCFDTPGDPIRFHFAVTWPKRVSNYHPISGRALVTIACRHGDKCLGQKKVALGAPGVPIRPHFGVPWPKRVSKYDPISGRTLVTIACCHSDKCLGAEKGCFWSPGGLSLGPTSGLCIPLRGPMRLLYIYIYLYLCRRARAKFEPSSKFKPSSTTFELDGVRRSSSRVRA
jgi:hypothetical protein